MKIRELEFAALGCEEPNLRWLGLGCWRRFPLRWFPPWRRWSLRCAPVAPMLSRDLAWLLNLINVLGCEIGEWGKIKGNDFGVLIVLCSEQIYSDVVKLSLVVEFIFVLTRMSIKMKYPPLRMNLKHAEGSSWAPISCYKECYIVEVQCSLLRMNWERWSIFVSTHFLLQGCQLQEWILKHVQVFSWASISSYQILVSRSKVPAPRNISQAHLTLFMVNPHSVSKIQSQYWGKYSSPAPIAAILLAIFGISNPIVCISVDRFLIHNLEKLLVPYLFYQLEIQYSRRLHDRPRPRTCKPPWGGCVLSGTSAAAWISRGMMCLGNRST